MNTITFGQHLQLMYLHAPWLFWGLALALLLQVLDVVSTVLALQNPNNREANGIIAFFMDMLSPGGWVILKLILALFAYYMLSEVTLRHPDLTAEATWLVWVLNLITIAVVINNIRLAGRKDDDEDDDYGREY